MDGSRFDALARALAVSGSRRRLIGAVVAGTLGVLGLRATEAAACRPVGSTCREHANCCSKRCGDKDATGRHRCWCQTAADCPAPDQCHDATCTEGVCGTTPLTGQACDDGDRCTVNDTCVAGACVAVVVICPPQDECHSAACDSASGDCVQTPLTGAPCDDGNSCTVGSTCLNGACQGGTPVDPTLTCPANVSQSNDPGQCGAVAIYAAPIVTCPTGAITCSPPSGSFFPVGTTSVTCTMENSSATCGFSVTITDTEAPTLTCPANQTTTSTDGQGVAVTFAPTASDNCLGVSVPCGPASGSTFPVGVTTVICSAIDAVGLTSLCAFNVTVTST